MIYPSVTIIGHDGGRPEFLPRIHDSNDRYGERRDRSPNSFDGEFDQADGGRPCPRDGRRPIVPRAQMPSYAQPLGSFVPALRSLPALRRTAKPQIGVS
jgi:hypothetical protein